MEGRRYGRNEGRDGGRGAARARGLEGRWEEDKMKNRAAEEK